MSWLSGLAGRAEDLLNKLDENAANALKEPSSRLISQGKREDIGNKIKKANAQKKITEKNLRTNSLTAKPTSLQVQKTTLLQKSEKESKQKTNNAVKLSNMLPISSRGLKKGTPFLVETLVLDDPNRNVFRQEDTHNEGNTPLTTLEEPQKNNDSKWIKKEIKDPDIDNKVSSLETENKMLQNELCIINNQVSILVQKAKNVEKLNENLQKKVYDLEKNYNEAIKENEVTLDEVENYKKMVNSQQTISSPDTSKLESTLKLLTEEKYMLLEKIKELEDSNNKLELTVMSTTSLKTKMENDLKASQNFCQDLESELTQAKDDVIKLEKDLEAYKIRAKGLLTMKEKIIDDMQNSDTNDSTKLLLTQIGQLKQERDELLQTMTKVTAEYEVMRRNARQSESQRAGVDKSNGVLRDAVRQERTAKEKAEHALSSLTRELKSAQMETSQQLAVLRTKLRDRDTELQRYQLSQATSYTTNALSETETCTSSGNLNVASSTDRDSTVKLHRLSQALVAKQAALDSMMADRNALRLQLEKTENKYRSDLLAAQSNRLQTRIINFQDNVTDDAKASSRTELRSIKGTFVSNTFRNAYLAFWTTSVKIGLFLRRHPFMRLMIFGYMALLHLWVFIVITTYSPEIHVV